MTMDSPTGDEGAEEGSGLTTAGVQDFFDGKTPDQFSKDYFDLRMSQGATRDDAAAGRAAWVARTRAKTRIQSDGR